MKIRQLHINRFGHFHECGLSFAGDGLQVIYGSNEAGKTTLLEFLRGLLFDFPARTSYDFGGQGEKIAGVATLELKNGQVCELRRRKGNKDKVAIKLDGQPTNMDEAGWLRLIDHADRNLFESIFAFGLGELTNGEKSLEHESLKSALFSGSLGGVNSPDKVIAEITQQADALFKKGGSKPAINAHLSEIKRLNKDIKERYLRPEAYHETEKGVAQAAERAGELCNSVDRLRREYSKIEKLLRASPKWWQLQQRLDERRSVIVPKKIPLDARQQFSEIVKDLRSLAAEQATRKEEIQDAERGLSGLKLDPTAISFRAEIKSCLELRQSYVEAKNDLPGRRRQRETEQQLIDRDLADLCPGWSHEDLRQLTVDIATRTQIDASVDQQRHRLTQQTKLIAKRDTDAASLQRAREDLAEIGEPKDVSNLVALLADEGDYVANQKLSDAMEKELRKLEQKIGTQVRKLALPGFTATTTVHELPVPRVEIIASFESQFANTHDQLRTMKASVEDDDDELREIQQSLDAAKSDKVVPSLLEREVAREQRDFGWNLIRRKYVSAEHLNDEIVKWLANENMSSLPDQYERSVREADNIADRIYENADTVAKREGYLRQITLLNMRREQKQKKIQELEQQLADLHIKWNEIWAACELVPITPDGMQGWVKDHEAVCASIAERGLLQAQQLQLQQRISAFEQRVTSAHQSRADDFSRLLAEVRQATETAKDQGRSVTELKKEIKRLEKQLVKYDTELDEFSKQELTAATDWKTLLRMLDFPEHWSMELAREVIDKLKATRVRLDSLPREDDRIAAMESRIEEFVKQVRSLCQSVQPELLRDPPELAIKKLDEQFESAVAAQRKHEDLSNRLANSQTQLQILLEQTSERAARRQQLFELAEVTTESDFLEAVSKAESALTLDREIDQLMRDLDVIRAGDNRDEFEHALSTSDLAVLERQERDLKEELKTADESRTKANGEEALARDALKRLNGSEEVAILTEELSRKQTLLTADIDRYMPLIYARYLLSSAVSRFEKENQPEMIATVSKLLSHMTGGKYVEFDRTGGDSQTILVRRQDGSEFTPQQLSTGTREQLYLAIRLAYVLHYCSKNEPLPIVIDDVLVNFDDQRARQTLSALVNISQTTQVLFFTCHNHMVEIARDVIPGLAPINLAQARFATAGL